MNALNTKTPGVYINEVDAFGNSVVPVATAVPAFIGYTPRAEYEGKSYYNKAQKITSLTDFMAFYTLPDPEPPADPAKQYSPNYYLMKQEEKPKSGEYMMINKKYYSILPDPSTIYYLYNSIRLFYKNGGGDAYIVAVNSYGDVSGKPLESVDSPLINPNVKLKDLSDGLDLLRNEEEPTMYICPEATLLSSEENATLMQSMLKQANDMMTTVCLFDIIGGRQPDPILYKKDIDTFRNSTGSLGLKYGVSYYPFIGTTIMSISEIDYTNLFGGNTKDLDELLNPPDAPDTDAAKVLSNIEKPSGAPLTVMQNNSALVNTSKNYKLIMKHVTSEANLLPPSGGMAGIYTGNDNQLNVWNSPANVSMLGVVSLPIYLSSVQQEDLNVDAVSGKSINVLRFFNGQGILVWGARTLDGNSNDWRYISVRRTLTFLEQSCKLAARPYVFSPNDANTWAAIKGMISSFLTSIWKEGGLQGTTPAEAFQVDIGLGSTMTAEDLLNGLLNVMVKVAVVRPAEFIVITFQQLMAKSG